MALQGRTIEVPLIGIAQQWPTTAGPAGRLRQVTNGVARKYLQTQSGTVLRVEKRDGFAALPTLVRDPTSGAVSSKSMQNPAMLTTYGKQLLAFAGAAAFVLSESAACYESPPYTCPADMLRAKSVYNASTVSSTPDEARIGSRAMYSWIDNTTGGGVLTMAMILDDDGTIVRQPFSVDSSHRVKVVADGTQFWLVWVQAGGLIAHAYDTNGNDLGNSSTAATGGSYYDVIKDPVVANRIVVVQKDGATAKVQVVTFTFSGGIVSVASATATGTTTNGRVAFWRNDSLDGKIYVGAIDGAGPYDYRLYQLNTAATLSHTYTITTALAAPQAHEMTGFVAPSGQADITAVLSYLDATPTPMLNYSQVWTVTFAGVSTLQATKRSVTLASRPLKLKDGSYYTVMYYQSDPASGVAGAVNLLTGVQQSTFFLLSLSNPYQICGRWDWGTAYADWQVTSDTTFYMHLSSPQVAADTGVHVALAYRSRSFNAAVATGLDIHPFGTQEVNAIGIEDVSFGPEAGQPFEAHGELLIPGPRASTFNGATISDHGLPLLPEVLTIADVAGGSLATGKTYSFVVVAENTDNNGNRTHISASKPIQVTLNGGHTAVTLTGCMLHTSSRQNIAISIYRNVVVGGIMSEEHHKVTSDLAPLFNADGSATWSFTDTVSDSAAANNEILYVDNDLLDQFPCPPFKAGCAAGLRAFVIGYDGALWPSLEKTPGDALAFNPALRVTFPNQDEAIAVQALDNFLVVLCKGASIYVLPRDGFPSNTGQGTLPTPTPLPFSNGCTGFALTTSDGIFYSSTQGGIWAITRSLQNVFAGAPVVDEFINSDGTFNAVTGIAIDGNQRTAVLLANSNLIVWDGIAQVWTKWQAQTASLITDHKGAFVLAKPSDGSTYRQTVGAIVDGASTPIITTTEVVVHFDGTVRGFRRVWNQQMQGENRGDHDLTVTETFDDNYGSTVFTYGPFTPPTPGAFKPMLIELPPKVEECSSVALKFVDSFPRGASLGYALELLAFDVATEQGLGRLVPSTQRIKAT